MKAALMFCGGTVENRKLGFEYRRGKNRIWESYQSFENYAELNTFFNRKKPFRMDVGPKLTEPPVFMRYRKEQKKQMAAGDHSQWIERELVIDVDLKDCPLRTCNCVGASKPKDVCFKCKLPLKQQGRSMHYRVCSCRWEYFNNAICAECWNLAQAYVLVLDYLLRCQWGFDEFYFVFSGGKGFHCWILDERALRFSKQERVNFLESLNPWHNINARKLKTESCLTDPVFVDDFEEFILPLFEEKILETGIFDLTHKATRTLLERCFNVDERDDKKCELFMKTVNSAFSAPTAVDAWRILMTGNRQMNNELEATVVCRRFVYAYMYPVLDEKITTDVSHFLKIPFSQHPTTGFISVPLTTQEFYSFSPTDAPHVDRPMKLAEYGRRFYNVRALYVVDLKKILYCPLGKLRNLNCSTWGRLSFEDLVKEIGEFLSRSTDRNDFFQTEFKYQMHSKACWKCDSYLLFQRQNNLQKLITSLSWIDGIYRVTFELALRVAMLRRLSELRLIDPVEELKYF